MLLWFVATAVLTVGAVFRDPRFDHRLLVVGSVLPLADAALGARVLHSVVVSIAVLVVVMLATSRGSDRRRTLLGLPIGMFLHLVFDASWNDTATFWWPLTGLAPPDGALPIVRHGWWGVALEAVGVVACAWLWRANGLGDAARRRRFLADGRLAVTAPSPRR